MASRGPSALSYGERMGDRSPMGSYRHLDERWRVGYGVAPKSMQPGKQK